MAPLTMTFTDTLVVTTCWCGINLAIPDSLEKEARRNGTRVYCPIGHTFVYGDTTMKRLQKEIEEKEAALARKQAMLDQAAARARDLEKSASVLRGQVTKAKNENGRLKRRVANGVCPCCKRTVKQLSAHMLEKHPEYVDEANG